MGTEIATHLLAFLLVLEGIVIGCHARDESFRTNKLLGAELLRKPFAVESTLTSCDFDDPNSPFCDWSQPKGDSGDWHRGHGQRPGESAGPPGGIPERRGYYIYPEAGESVQLQSPDLDPAAPEVCVEFLYYLYSLNAQGQLMVNVQDASGNTSTLWTRKGMQSSAWLLGAVAVQNPAQRPFKVVFAATQAETKEINMALDSISVRVGPCSPCMTGCDFDIVDDLCEWENPRKDEIQWEQWNGPGQQPGVGPEDDFSKPAFGSYMLLDSLDPDASGAALLKSPPYHSLGGCLSLSFYYTLHGVSSDTALNVYAAEPGGELGSPLLSLSGEHGPSWKPGTINYTRAAKNIQFVIEGAYRGKPGLAVDSVRISPCEEIFAQCDFNNKLDPFCGWVQPGDNKANWTWAQGSTPTEETGPSGDYPNGEGHYIYAEAGSLERGQSMRLSSQAFCTDTDACVEFYYHMYGTVPVDTQLRVLAQGPSGATVTLWARTGKQSPTWLFGSVTVPYGGPQPSKVIFEAIRGSNPYLDVALDNISVRRGACAASATPTPSAPSSTLTSTHTGSDVTVSPGGSTLPRPTTVSHASPTATSHKITTTHSTHTTARPQSSTVPKPYTTTMESTAGKPTATSQGSSRTTRHVVPDISSSPGPANITQSGRTTTLTTPAGSATTTRRGSSTTTDQATTSQKKPATTSSTRTTGHGTAAAISTTSNSNIKTSTISTAASHSPTGGLPSTTTGHASHATATISHTSGSSANATTAGCTSPTMSTSTTRQVSSPRTSSSPTSPPHVSPTTDHPIVTQYTTSQAGPVTTSPTATSWPRTTGYEKPSTTSHTTSSQPRTTGHEKPSTVSHTTSSQPRTTGHEKPSTARYTTSSQPRTTGHEKPSTVSHTTSSQPRTTGHEKPSTASHTTSSQPRTTGHEKPSTARHTTSSQPRTTGHEKPSTARHTTSSQPRTTGHEKPSTVSHTTSSQPRTTGHEKPSTARHTTSSQPRTTGHEKPSTTSPTATSWPRTTGHKEPSTTSHATSSWASPNSTVGHSEPSTTKSILTSTTISSISQSSSATASHGSPATKHTTPTHHVNGTTTSQGSSTASHVSPRTTRLPPATSGSPTTMSPASPVTSHSNATATAAVATSMSHASTMATTRPSSATTWHVRESTATHATSHTAITAGQTTITSTKISSTSTPTGSVATATTSAPSTTVAKLTSTPGVSTRTTATTETPVPSPDREICTISGDPHYTTYDGRLFHFMGTCTYLLSALCNATSGLPTFRIVATNEHRGGNKQVSYVKSVSVEVYGIQIVLLKGRRVTVDGQRVTLPVFLAGRQVSVRLSGTFALVQTDFGLWVRFDGNHHMEVSAPATYMGQLCGLCGNYNGQTSDDNLMPNGTSAGENAEKLGESWQIPDAGDTGCTNSGGPGQCDKDIAADALKPTSCGILTDPQGPFAPCHSKVPPEGAFVNCVYDLCGTDGDAGSLCFALQSYADRCAQAGITITWRNNSFCPLNCPPGTSYTSCGPVCPATCRDPAFNTSCPNLLCVEGCVCDKGYILSGDQCVPLDQCGCTDPSGQYHPVGESWMGNSNCTQRCTCAPFDNITCEEWNCSPVQECRPLEGLLGCQDTGVAACHVAGDPHYYTFDGTMVSFMGTCTYILVTLCHSDPRLPSFNITAKNEERGQPEASYLRHVTVEVAGVTITLQKSRRVLIDGQRVRTPVEGLIPGVSVTTSGIYVVLETNFGLVVKFDGNHHLEIQLPGTYFDKVCGMCGNFNNQSRDDLLMANRQLAANASQFGNSWKAPGDADPGCQPDNREDLEPRCSAQEMQHLQALCREILEPKYQPCHGIIDPQPFIQNCLYDMCEYQGMASVLCDNIQSYVEACKSQGAVGLSWRNITFCPLPCPLHSHYTNCSSPCPATCANLYAPASCQRPTACAEGCACDRGYILSDDTCVSMRDCGCLDNRHEYYNPGDTWVNANCLQRCTCIGNGEITCQPFQCVPGSHCALSTSGLRYCRPTKFHQCVISGDPHYRTFDNFVHHFQGRATYVLTRTLDDLPRALEPFSISGRNRRRFPLHRFSFLREVYVSVYGYSITLMEGRKMAINGVKVTPPYYPRDGLQITQRGRTLFVQTDFGISVSFDGRDFAEIVLPSTYQNHVGGLCGNYDGWPNNEYMKLDKTWTHNLNAFGNSWQVSVQRAVLGREREAASHPRIRREEPLDEAETGFQIDCTPEELIVVNGTRVCGALSDPQGPFAACHGVLSPSNFQESCVYDLCALYDDKELLCEDYEAYALLCQEEGVTLGPWRQKMGCEISCPLHTTYKSCMTACPASCANMAAPSDCDAPCVEGCASDPGHILSGLDSVPYNQCGCTSNGQYYEINDSFFMEDCSQQCTCRNTGTLECVAVGCPGGQICAVANFTRGCFKETPCLSNPCQNEGVCEDTTDSFICVCPEGYAGRLCEEMPLDVVSAENTLTAILIGVLVPLGLILIAVTAVCIYRRRSKKKLREEHIPVLSNPGRGKASAMTGDRITRL